MEKIFFVFVFVSVSVFVFVSVFAFVFVIVFLIFYLVFALLPFYCKVDEEEGELPLHEQGKEKIQNGAANSSKPFTLFQSPPGILRF